MGSGQRANCGIKNQTSNRGSEMRTNWSDWPNTERLPKGVNSKVSEGRRGNAARYTGSRSKVMSYPGTEAHPVASGVFKKLISANINHIGFHTLGACESGFAGTQEIECRG